MQNTTKALAAVAVVSIAATVPVWMPRFPPMTDLPQHAAQLALIRELHARGFPYASLFQINWFTPYLLGYLLVYAVAGVTGMVVASKLVVSAALASVPIATAALLAELESEPLLAVLAIPTLYGFNYQWGFLNFLVAAPVGLLFLALVVRFSRTPTPVRGIQVAAAINLLFFCHAMTALALGAAAGVIVLSSAPNARAAIRRCVPLASVVILMALWGVQSTAQPDTHWPTDWDFGWWRAHQDYYASTAVWARNGGLGWGRVAGLFPYVFGLRPGWPVFMAAAVTLALPFAANARPARSPAACMPLAILVLIVLFAPSAVFGADFVWQRFAIFVVPFYLAVFHVPSGRSSRPAWILCAIFVTVWIAGVVVRTRAYERESDGFSGVLARMEPGARALYFPFERDSSLTIAPTFLHYGSWYSALRQGVVDPSFAVHYMELVRYVPDEEAGMRLWGFEFNPEGFDWDYFEGWKFRYFVARAGTDPYSRMFSEVPCRIELRFHVNHWWLYERDPGCHE